MRLRRLTGTIALTLGVTPLLLACSARTSDAQLILRYIDGLLNTLPQ